MARKVTPRPKTIFRKPNTRFKKWRKYREMTLERAAELSGMTAGNISAMERGTQGFTEDGLYALAGAYKVPPGWLLDVDPESLDSFLPAWDAATPGDRQKIVEIAKTITGRG